MFPELKDMLVGTMIDKVASKLPPNSDAYQRAKCKADIIYYHKYFVFEGLDLLRQKAIDRWPELEGELKYFGC